MCVCVSMAIVTKLEKWRFTFTFTMKVLKYDKEQYLILPGFLQNSSVIHFKIIQLHTLPTQTEISVLLCLRELHRCWRPSSYLLKSSSSFSRLILSASIWPCRRPFSCLNRDVWDSKDVICALIVSSSSVAERSFSTETASWAWASAETDKEVNSFLNHR